MGAGAQRWFRDDRRYVAACALWLYQQEILLTQRIGASTKRQRAEVHAWIDAWLAIDRALR